MNSPSTFVGKCVTLLIGGVLSYLTVLHPDAEILAGAIFGKPQPEARVEPDHDANRLNVGPAASKQEPATNGSRFGQAAANPSVASQQMARSAQTQLQAAMGASAPVTLVATHPASIQNSTNDREPNDSKLTQPKPSERSGPSSLNQIDQISTRLRQLGASYLLLEKLPKPHGDQFRVRCDLANELQPVKCCFEATRETALAAMQDVLRAVVNYDPLHQRQSDVPTTSVASGR